MTFLQCNLASVVLLTLVWLANQAQDQGCDFVSGKRLHILFSRRRSFRLTIIFMEALKYLCDVANGKRRRFFNVSAKAVELFRKWVLDWHNAQTLEEVLDNWEMAHVLEDYVQTRTEYDGKKLQVKIAQPRAPWTNDSVTESVNVNDELVYLVLLLITAPGCERLRRCPECGIWLVAPRLSQKFCGSMCGRRSAARRTVTSNYAREHERKTKACKEAYEKYHKLKIKPRKSAAEYVLAEANRHLPAAYKIGGVKLQLNFITHNAAAIGLPVSRPHK